MRNFRIGVIGLALAAMLAALTPAFADQLADIKSAGVLRVAVPQDFPPFGFSNEKMEVVGYDIDMSKLIASRLGVKLEMTPVASANRVPYLTANRIDIIVSSLGKNPDREKVIDFTEAYAPFFSGVYGTPAVKVSTPADLAGKKLAVIGGSTEDLAITKIAPPGATILRFADGTATNAAFLSGQADLLVAGNVVAAALLDTKPVRVPEMKLMIEDSPCYIGTAKGQPALLAALNKIIADAEKDGTLNKISQTWLHADLPASF
jgi:polar amino acid transport system substrate-binding protein